MENITHRQIEETNGLPERIQKIRQQFFEVKPSISIERAKATTKVYRENQGLPTVLLRAKAFYQACKTIPININEGELIIGHPAGKRRAGVFSPEIAWRWVKDELDTIDKRAQDPYVIEEKDKKILKEEIFPFWEGKSVDEFVYRELEEIDVLPLTYETGIIDAEVKSCNGAGEVSPGYGNILFKKGFNGIKKNAEKSLKNFDLKNVDDIEKIYFLRAVIKICDAMVILGNRYSKLAKKLAKEENDEKRRSELESIAKICRHVPGKPPRSFHEALQAIWFATVGIFLEENAAGQSPGRVDQYVYPFYKHDVDSGVITDEEAKELMYCFLMKFNEIPWLLSEFAAKYFAGYIPFLNLCVGGQTRNGKDATNELTYMIIDCSKNLKMYQPSLAARIHNNSPQEFLLTIGRMVRAGLGFPACHFDDTTIKMLLSHGISMEDARDHCFIGCVEPFIHGKLYQWTSVCYTNFPIAIEFALTNGLQSVSGKKLGIETGDPASFKIFEDFEAAVKEQLKALIRVNAIVTIITQLAQKKYLPKPFTSSLIEGCVESGKGVMSGGAIYNWGPGVIWVGTADYANSMAAVKKLVFEDKSISMKQLCEALKSDFEGYEDVYQACVNVPKYGNDIDYVDSFATDIIDFAEEEMGKHKSLYAKMGIGTLSVSTNTPQGLVVGTLPSGRKSTLPLSDGISPAQGTDTKGPTSIIKSADKINQEAMTIGVLHNMKLDPALIADDRGLTNFAALLRTHSQLGGSQLQFNCVSGKMLLDAQKHPDQYKDLMIRVAGYSAYFVELCKDIQDEIISRTPQSNWN